MKKMILTGAIAILQPGTSIQLVVGILVVLFNMLLVLKVAPFVDSTDDWLSFLTSMQMLLTLLGGLLLLTDYPDKPVYPSHVMGGIMVFINSLSFVALAMSLIGLHPKVRKCINARS